MTQSETEEDGGLHGSESKNVSYQSWLTDVQNPLNWSPLRKWMIVWLLVITNTIAYARSGMPAAPIPLPFQ